MVVETPAPVPAPAPAPIPAPVPAPVPVYDFRPMLAEPEAPVRPVAETFAPRPVVPYAPPAPVRPAAQPHYVQPTVFVAQAQAQAQAQAHAVQSYEPMMPSVGHYSPQYQNYQPMPYQQALGPYYSQRPRPQLVAQSAQFVPRRQGYFPQPQQPLPNYLAAPDESGYQYERPQPRPQPPCDCQKGSLPAASNQYLPPYRHQLK